MAKKTKESKNSSKEKESESRGSSSNKNPRVSKNSKISKKVVKAALKKPKSASALNLKKEKEPMMIVEPFNAGTAFKAPKNI